MPIGGAERVLCDILDRLDYNKHDVTLLLYNNWGTLLNAVPNNVKILSLYGPPTNSLPHRLIERIFNIVGLRKTIDKIKTRLLIDNHYDAIISFCHGHGHMMHSFIFQKTKNNISWIHSDLSISNWGLPFFDNDIKKQELAYNKMDSLVFVSADAQKSFHKVFDINKNISEEVIYNFVNQKHILESSKVPLSFPRKRKFTFITIGRLVEAKRQDRIIEAARILKDQDIDFEIWIVGDGPLKQILQKSIDLYGLQGQVILLGSQSNPYKYLSAADCFLLTSSQEGFAIVLVEAFILSKPVISMKSSGPSEIIGDSKYGILIDQSVQQLVDAMKRMISDNELKLHYAKIARERSKDFLGEDSLRKIHKVIFKES